MDRDSIEMPPAYSTGWIYILSNRSMRGLLKIGYTRRTVEERVKQLSNHTGVPSRFVCVYYCRVRSPEAVERAVHRLLAYYEADKEFFEVEFERAVLSVRQAASNLNIRLEDQWRHPKYPSRPTVIGVTTADPLMTANRDPAAGIKPPRTADQNAAPALRRMYHFPKITAFPK
jgi:hypothetical protein